MNRGFRVWDNQEKTYNVMSDLVISPTGYLMEISFGNGGIWEYTYADENRYIVEFDTGLKDRNGEKITEGDIVKMPDWYIEREIEVVKYYKAGFYPFQEGCLDCSSPDGYEVEVIGNIHENADLLGK